MVEQYIIDNFKSKTNKEIALALGLNLSYIRRKAYSLGLFRIELQLWTEEQVNFLRENYGVIGDTELANIFQEKFKKNKSWNKEQIQKKRKSLKLKRTPEQLKLINKRNFSLGLYKDSYKKIWADRPQLENNKIVYWKIDKLLVPYIKIEGKYYSWSRYTWIQNYGAIQKGFVVVFKDGNNRNLSVENLELISFAENAKRNSSVSSQGLSDNYVASILSYKNKGLRKELLKNKQLLETKRLTIKLKRICKTM